MDLLDAPQIYLCGVPDMIVESKEALDPAGVPDDRLFTEGWEEGAVSD